MTVIVKYDENGKPYYRSGKGVGSSDAERKRADQLDRLLKSSIEEMEKRLFKRRLLKKDSNGNVEIYWMLGKALKEILLESNLIDETERHLFWLNAKLHVPKNLMAKDRGPNRQHLEYCFRLAGFTKEKAMKMKWGEWVYLYDSPGINKEQRFDEWLDIKMEEEPNQFTRKDIRILAQTINKLLGNTETKDLSNEQIKKCYEAAWQIKLKITERNVSTDNKAIKETLKNSIEKNRQRLGDVIEGTLAPKEFAQLVVKSL